MAERVADRSIRAGRGCVPFHWLLRVTSTSHARIPVPPPQPAVSGHARAPGPRNNDGEAGTLIAEELSHDQITMTVHASDGYVTVSGCTFLAAS
jgi:hypothetical protein